VRQDEDLDDLRSQLLQPRDRAVVGDQRRAVRPERVAEHLGDARLNVVCGGVEVLADGRHHAAGKVSATQSLSHHSLSI
jgi:hypothetical protein